MAGRKHLSREIVLTQALAEIDEQGLEQFSLRKLAGRLGVEPMSIYHYFAGKGEILDGVADHLVARVPLPALSGPWQDRLRQAMRSYRAVALKHPRAFPLMATRRFNQPASLAFLDRLLAILERAGFDPPGRARAFRMLGFYLHGALWAELSVLGRTPDPTPSRIDAGGVGPGFPQVAACAPYLGPAYLEANFEAGLEAMLRILEDHP